jgi:hypothetical protein
MKKYFFLFTLLTLLQVSPSLCSYENIGYPYPTLSLSGKAQIQKPADEFFLKIGVVTVKETAEKALSENNQKIDAIIGSLISVGLKEGEYQTGRFSIQPTYTPYPKDPPPQWKATINGYEVTNNLIIQSKKLDLIGALIDAAGRSGATTIDDMRFVISDPDRFTNEVVEKATNRAMDNALYMAKAARVSLGRLLSITLNPQDNDPIYRPVNFAKMDVGSVPTIEPGNVTISATVNLVYEIIGQ